MPLRVPLYIAVLALIGACSTTQHSQKGGALSPRLSLPLNEKSAISTDEVLSSLRWESLSVICGGNASYCSARMDTRSDSLVKEFTLHYFDANVDLTSYRGRVIEYEVSELQRPSTIDASYFDAQTYTEYADQVLTRTLGEAASDSLGLDPQTRHAPSLRAYYQLLGVGVRDEYGWICEYSTVGSPPAQRQATLTLVEYWQVELLRKVLHGPNLEGQVYAADALLYLSEADTLSLKERSRRKIARLQQSQDTLRTCGNRGSYKIYPKPVHKVLTDSTIARIPEEYQSLADLGYFDPDGT